jgi:hypothetical protein
MSSTMAQAGRYAAVRVAEDGEDPWGVVAIDPSGAMTVESTTPAAAEEPGQEDKLSRAVRLANRDKVMYVDIPPPEDAPMFTLASRIVERGHPDFIPALFDYLRASYLLELRPL